MFDFVKGHEMQVEKRLLFFSPNSHYTNESAATNVQQ